MAGFDESVLVFPILLSVDYCCGCDALEMILQ
jgi:hypothetical protein